LPAIISVFLGDQLSDVYNQIEQAGTATTSRQGSQLMLGSVVLPHLPAHAGDRNRTSPFAFTGNKFEFRALGSSQSISFPATVLNTIVAETIKEMCDGLEAEIAKGAQLETAISGIIAKEYAQVKRIVFNGDGYSEDWHQEAERRGLLNMRSTLDALPVLSNEKNAALFESFGVLTRRELESRAEVAYDQYFKTVNIEGETTAELASTMVLPAAIRYLQELTDVAQRASGLGMKADGTLRTLHDVNELVNQLTDALGRLREGNAELGGESVHEKAHHMRDHIIPAMAEVRTAVDQLEKMIPDDLWPMPRYREMLFIR
jgi:glutamine synthetase